MSTKTLNLLTDIVALPAPSGSIAHSHSVGRPGAA